MKCIYILKIIFIILFIIIIVLHEYELFGNLHRRIYPQYYNDGYFKVKDINYFDVRKGKEISSGKRIVFCGLCRDIGHIISKNIELFEKTGKYFKDYRIILFENDSKDNTRDIIKQKRSKNDKIILLDCGEQNPNCIYKDKRMYDYGSLSSKRIERMSHFRNQYMNYINTFLSDYEYVMMMDMDLEGYFNYYGLMETIAKDNWDAVFSNGRMGMVGTFGFMDCMYDGMAYVDHTTPIEKIANNQSSIEVFKKFIKMQTLNDKWIPVKSAFNGCGIYKMSSIKNISFRPNYSCEWIGFHHQMSINGHNKLFIARDWKIYSGKQGDSFLKFLLS